VQLYICIWEGSGWPELAPGLPYLQYVDWLLGAWVQHMHTPLTVTCKDNVQLLGGSSSSSSSASSSSSSSEGRSSAYD
jgi:hypothetical protein